VSWRVTDPEGLSQRPISVSYTTDDRTYTEVASGLVDGAGNGRATTPTVGSVATEEGMKLSSWTQWSELFAVNPDGAVYFSREGRLSLRKRDSGSWIDLVGDGNTEYSDGALGRRRVPITIGIGSKKAAS